jgi:hypothetical protein
VGTWSNRGPAVYQNSRGKPIDLSETKLIALIAYLQRVGTDLYAQPVAENAAPAQAPLPDANSNPAPVDAQEPAPDNKTDAPITAPINGPAPSKTTLQVGRDP